MMPENPYNYNLPTPPERFVGRWPLVEQIVADLCRARPDSWAVIGGRRFGKSSLLKAVEARLLARLRQCEPGERRVYPLIVDLKSAQTAGEGNVYARILHLLQRAMRRCFVTRTPPPPLLREASREDSLPFSRFEEVLEVLWDELEEGEDNPVRLILLLDEAEAMMRFPWAETLFNQLRSLVYDGPLVGFVRLVLTGASQVIRAKHAGSPLLNMVRIEHLEALPDPAIDELLAWGGGMPPDAAAEVKAQSGGHPFIAQYLLYHLWDGELTQATVEQVQEVADRMQQRRAADLHGWWDAIGDGGQRAYALLAEAQVWVDERTLIEQVKGTTQPLDQGLTALCYHGLVIRRGRRYRVAGELFRQWFLRFGRPTLTSPSPPSPSNAPKGPKSIYNVYIQQGSNVPIGDGAHIESRK